MFRLGALVLLGLLLLARPDIAVAQTVMEPPVYNPETKSYFTLVTTGSTALPHTSWAASQQIALSLTFKGVHGRMAVIKSKSVNDFLRDNFTAKQATWIGLRYFCHYNVSLWVDGTRLNRTDYQNWSARWDSTVGVACQGRDGYYPAFYWPKTKDFRWAVQGPGKHFGEMFVEFVTNGE